LRVGLDERIKKTMIKYICMVTIIFLNISLLYAGELETTLLSINGKLDGIEIRIDGINKRIDSTNQRIDDTNKRIDDVNKRLDDSRAYDLAAIIAILSLMALILWDRRTALKPLNDIISKLQEKIDFMWKHFNFDRKQSIILK